MMQIIENDAFYDLAEQYDSASEHSSVGEVEYFLLCDDQPYEGLYSHREALRCVFDLLVKESANVGKNHGEQIADLPDPISYEIGQAKASLMDPRVFFDCPDIINIDYYGNVRYDAEWRPDDGNFGTTVPYWYAVMEPIHGRKNRPEDFRKVNSALFPNGTDHLDIYEWTTDWSDYFDDGHEWYGACCWSIYDKSINRYAVMLVSATD
jgi:hypothetical protein